MQAVNKKEKGERMKKHKVMTVLAVLPLLTIPGAAVFASSAVNSDTGSCSENRTSVYVENIKNISNKNTGEVDNNIDVVLTTGGNTDGGSIKSGEVFFGSHQSEPDKTGFESTQSAEIKTGDAIADVKVTNKLNENKTCIGEECMAPAEEAEGIGGGPVEEATPQEPTETTAAEGGMGGGEINELVAAGSNSILAVIPLIVGTLTMLYLIRLRKSTF